VPPVARGAIEGKRATPRSRHAAAQARECQDDCDRSESLQRIRWATDSCDQGFAAPTRLSGRPARTRLSARDCPHRRGADRRRDAAIPVLPAPLTNHPLSAKPAL
jgi:hypothetical protein